MINTINFAKLTTSKDESSKYLVDYGNNTLMPFFAQLGGSNRNAATDNLCLNVMSYVIQHYDTFQGECTPLDKQKLLFSICRTACYLTNKIITGGSTNGLVDKYVIAHGTNHYGFEDNNIFRDLKYLQKITAYDRTDFSPSFYGAIKPEELEGMWHDMLGHLRSIIMLELDGSKTEAIKMIERPSYLNVTQYSNIFAVAASYREQQRLQDAKDYLERAVESLTGPILNPEQSLFMVFRAITVVGEFSSQKNLTFQTRLNNPEFTPSLERIKNVTNAIVKPDQYNKFTAAIIQKIDFNTLKQQLEYLLKGLEQLITLSTDATYAEKVDYYTNPMPLQLPYLAEGLIIKLRVLITTEFPHLSQDQSDKVEKLLQSDKKEKFIGDIFKICKCNAQQREIREKYKTLIDEVISYEPPQDVPTQPMTREIEKLVSLLKSDTASAKPIKDSAHDILDTLSVFLSQGGSCLPTPMQDDNPISLKLEKLITGQSLDGNSVLLMKIFSPDGFKTIKISYNDSMASSVLNAIVSIELYHQCDVIAFPQIFFGRERAFITKEEMTQSEYNQFIDKFIQYVSGHPSEVLDYIINYGQYCQMYQFIKSECNQQALEFVLQTSYTLVKDAKEEGAELAFSEQEYRALRHAIRHSEDNLDVLEVPTPIEQIYAYYAIRFLGEDIAHDIV